MNFLKMYTPIFLLVLFACENPNAAADYSTLHEEIQTLKNELRAATTNTKGQLVHAVYFNLKNDLTEEQKTTVLEELHRLDSIEELRDFQVGSFADMGDKRALSDFEMAILMEFDDEAAYRAYQEHTTHLDVKKNLGDFLAVAPVSYDFWTE